jgi:hypothetical protein
VGPAVSALEVDDPAFGARAGSQLVCRREIDEIFGLQVRSKFAARLGETATVETGIAVTWFVTGFPDPFRTGRSTTPSPGSGHLVLTAARVARPVFDELAGRASTSPRPSV